LKDVLLLEVVTSFCLPGSEDCERISLLQQQQCFYLPVYETATLLGNR